MRTLLTLFVLLALAGAALASPPAADFEADIRQGGTPVTVQFTDLSTGAPTTWAWTFGDGGTASAQNPVHTYETAGTFTVSLTATNADGSDTETKVGYIIVGAYPHFGTNTLGCYFDDDGVFEDGQELVNEQEYSMNSPFTLRFVLSDCSQLSIGGFEFAWRFDPEPTGAYFIIGSSLPPGALNIGTTTNFIVGLGTPLIMADQHMQLATVTILPTFQGEELDIQVSQSSPSSIPGPPDEHGYCVFNDGEDPGLLLIMAYATVDLAEATYTQVEAGLPGPAGDLFFVDTPLAHVGAEPGPVATEARTLSDIKAIFR